jgi:hypothetical protein
MALPIVLLLLVSRMVHASGRYGLWRPAALFVPISLAFVLTVGRGIWVAFAVGLVVTALLWHRSRAASGRRAWHAVALVVLTIGAIGGTAALFQRFTGAAVGAQAMGRMVRVFDYASDVQILGRLSNYASTVERIAARPLLGSGQGATLPFFIFDQDSGDFGVHESWTVDSLYLALLWKSGLVGLVAFAWMALATLRAAWRTFVSASQPEVRAFAGGAVALGCAMAVMGISDSSLVNGRFALVFGVLVGMVAVVARESGRHAPADDSHALTEDSQVLAASGAL